MKHSELPWTIEPCASGGGLICKGTSRSAQSHIQIYPMADAQFIVKACNNHYKLMKLLTTAYDLVEESISDTKQYDYEVRAKSLVMQAMQAIKEAE